MKILVTPTSFKQVDRNPALDMLRSFSKDIVFNPQTRPLTELELIPLLSGCQGFIAGVDFITRKVMENAPDLKVISRYGTGVDRIDLEAAKERGIVICNTPGANANAVADLIFAMLLSIARKLLILDRKTREGEWPRSTGLELYGKTIGILGLGAVGKAVVKRAAGFSMNIITNDYFTNREYARSQGIRSASLEDVVKEVDILSINLPLTEQTRNILNGDLMRTMKKGAIIINTARGGIMDEAVAYELLKTNHLGGLGIDVFDTEPPGPSPLFTLDSVVVTPHTGAHTTEAMEAMSYLSVKNLIDVLSGRNCQNIVR